MIKTYFDLISLPTFKERFEYLKLSSRIGEETFGFERHLNQVLYRSPEWKRFRRDIIIRDNGCDLADPDYEIHGSLIIIHHINPITKNDIVNRSQMIFDPNNVITTSFNTHNAIHYGDYSLIPHLSPERAPNDTSPWRQS